MVELLNKSVPYCLFLIGNIENIIVKIDGEDYPLNELAVISKKNPNLIAINMSDFPEVICNIFYELYF